MPNLWHLKPIGYMTSVFHHKNGTPRQPAICTHAQGSITIEKAVFNNPEHSLEDLDNFSHVWIMFLFHKNNNAHTKAKVKPPRLDGRRVGVFSTRSPYRPNAIGLTLAAVDKIQGATIFLKGIDILDGTPILDIKPYIPDYDVPVTMVTKSDQYLKTESQRPDPTDISLQEDKSVANSISNPCLLKGSRSLETGENQPSSSEVDIEKTNDENSGGIVFSGSKQSNTSENSVNTDESITTCNKQSMVNQQHGDEGEVTLDTLSSSLLSDFTETKHSDNSDVKTADWIRKVRKLRVRFTPTATEQLRRFSSDSPDSNFRLNLFSCVGDVEAAIQEVLNEDPRSVYRRQKCRDSLYFFSIDIVHVTCWFDDVTAEVVRIQPVTFVPQCS
ncbi:tRNA (adenine(37)-N6)-methyltransferase-like isoform X2 [Haliotis asinina]|uniref:tRNA (adenine(37)-N6)-methyltransferase-like isoform X2 n=2 Tax=Haliotis asinina TaxID=109174 RepID=UPI0035326F24